MYSLEREFVDLRARRVALREGIKRVSMARAMAAANGDPTTHREVLVNLERELRWSEKRWAELHAMLGRRLPGPPVKLAPARSSVRYAAPQRQVPGYVNRMITAK